MHWESYHLLDTKSFLGLSFFLLSWGYKSRSTLYILNFEGLHPVSSAMCYWMVQRTSACLYSKVFTISSFLITVLETLNCYLLVDHSWYMSLLQPLQFRSAQKMAEEQDEQRCDKILHSSPGQKKQHLSSVNQVLDLLWVLVLISSYNCYIITLIPYKVVCVQRSVPFSSSSSSSRLFLSPRLASGSKEVLCWEPSVSAPQDCACVQTVIVLGLLGLAQRGFSRLH